MCVLEFQNTKEETPKPHHGDKSPKHEKVETFFILNWVLTTQKLLFKIFTCNEYLRNCFNRPFPYCHEKLQSETKYQVDYNLSIS